MANARLVVTKSLRRADLYSSGTLVKSYRIVLGGSPEGHKTRKGDGRTPEGRYRICTRLNRSRFKIFLGLNYPNGRDATAALSRGAITKAQAARITAAEREHRQPPWDTPLSGAIGLHGGGTRSDWTAGCIAFDDVAIQELLIATKHWTAVEVRP